MATERSYIEDHRSSPILVTGGTGTLGGHVVPLLRREREEVRVLSRHPREGPNGVDHVTADLVAGTGIDAAVDGVETVLHLAGGRKGDDRAAGNLVEAASRAGVQHIVHISVIGADQIPLSCASCATWAGIYSGGD